MRRWLPPVLVIGAVLFSLAVYGRLPEQVPVHWGVGGEPDRFGSRVEGAFLLPAIMIALLALLRWYPSRDPRAGNIAKFRDSYDLAVTVLIAFLAALHVVLVGIALGWNIDLPTYILIGTGLLFVLIGNLMPRARSNFIFGIRTPWTLSSDRVWERSHRVGGYTMVAAGLAVMVSAFLPRPVGVGVLLASLLATAVVPIVYSYVAWTQERGTPGGE